MNISQHYNIILSHLSLGDGGVLSHLANWWMSKKMLDQADIISFFFISWVAEVHIILQQHVH